MMMILFIALYNWYTLLHYFLFHSNQIDRLRLYRIFIWLSPSILLIQKQHHTPNTTINCDSSRWLQWLACECVRCVFSIYLSHKRCINLLVHEYHVTCVLASDYNTSNLLIEFAYYLNETHDAARSNIQCTFVNRNFHRNSSVFGNVAHTTAMAHTQCKLSRTIGFIYYFFRWACSICELIVPIVGCNWTNSSHQIYRNPCYIVRD